MTEYVTVRRGETYRLDITAQDENSDDVSLDGWSFASTVRKIGNGGVVQHEFAFGSGTTASVDTGTWDIGNYAYDVRLTDPDGAEYYSDKTVIKLTDGPTQPAE